MYCLCVVTEASLGSTLLPGSSCAVLSCCWTWSPPGCLSSYCSLDLGLVFCRCFFTIVVLVLLLLLLLLLLHPLNGLFSRTTRVSRYQKGKTSLDLNEARDYGVLGCSGISWTMCKQSAPRSTQITTPTPHDSICSGQMLFLMPNQQCQTTEGISSVSL